MKHTLPALSVLAVILAVATPAFADNGDGLVGTSQPANAASAPAPQQTFKPVDNSASLEQTQGVPVNDQEPDEDTGRGFGGGGFGPRGGGFPHGGGMPHDFHPDFHPVHHDPMIFHGGHFGWAAWAHPGIVLLTWAAFDAWRWSEVTAVTCTAVDSVGNAYPVTESGYVGLGYRPVIGDTEGAALNRCYAESGGDPACRPTTPACEPVY